ncbi:MAG: VOC family protein [Lachnospiraceae bacterium]|nr:VOC family protein [Lachnospiraceae bacterium]
MDLHHFGIATVNMEESILLYEMLGFKCEGGSVEDTDRNLRIVFMSNGSTLIELIQKSNKDAKSPVDAFLGKGKNQSIYHSCYLVPDLEKSIDKLREYNFILTDEPKPAIAFHGKRVCFLYNHFVGMIELCES